MTVFARKNILQIKRHNSKSAADLLHKFTYTTVDHIHNTHTYVYVYTYIHVHIYLCVYMYIYMYIHHVYTE